MTVTPILHCLLEREPKSFHVDDAAGTTVTYSINVAFEVASDGLGTVADEEKLAETYFAKFCATLDQINFYYYHFSETHGITTNGTLLKNISEVPHSGYKTFFKWLQARRLESSAERFWTTVKNTDPDVAVEASGADASILSRTASSWNAPIGHKLALTHLVRFPAKGKDGRIVVLPYFAAPSSIPTYQGQVGQTDAYDFAYEPQLGWLATGRTQIFEPWRSIDPLGGQPGAIVDPDMDVNGYLKLNKNGEKLSRFLDRFESRTSALLSANAGLQLSADELRSRINIVNSGTEDKPVYHWGEASWYTIARLLSALDASIIALLQPGRSAEVGEAVLAPIAIAILDALDEWRKDVGGLPDYEPKDIYGAVRHVLSTQSPLVNKQFADALLAKALEHVYDIRPALADPAKDVDIDEPPAMLVALLIAAYHKHPNGVAPDTVHKFLASLKGETVEALTVALADYEQLLHVESGAETALIRIFETTELRADGTPPQSEDRFARKLAAALPTQFGLGTREDIAQREGVAQGWENYRAMLAGPYNGAEAIRRALAGAATHALLGAAAQPLDVIDLERRVGEANYQARRFETGTQPQCFNVIAAALVVPKGRPAAPSFASELKESYKSVAIIEPSAIPRFVPDTFPKPLPLQIAAGIDGQSLDGFARAFNGIGVAVCRHDPHDATWSYANLADLAWHEKRLDTTQPIYGAIHPATPAVTDGRGTMFLNYDGTPFADRPDLATLQDGASYVNAKTFYTAAPYSFPSGPSFQRLPRLAYGRLFQSFSFVVTNGGTLPLGLQEFETLPWMPRPDIGPLVAGTATDYHGNLLDKPSVIVDYPCSRRTAIAQMAIEVAGNKHMPGRIGQEIAGVHPLSKDYPRLGTVARKDGKGVLDLFRDNDGLGRMIFPDKPTEQSWIIADLATTGSKGTLKIDIFDRLAEGPDSTGFETFKCLDISQYRHLTLTLKDRLFTRPGVPPGTRYRRSLSLSSEKGPIKTIVLSIGKLLKERACWIRLTLDTTGANESAMSFADPASQRSNAQSTPLLLLAPTATDWATDLNKPVDTVVRTPRVGYVDFSRWMANGDLAATAAGAEKTKFGQLIEMLAIANRMRHLSPNLGRYLDNLPDPAVTQIALELQSTDTIDGSAHAPIRLLHPVASLEAWLKAKSFARIDPDPEFLIEKFLSPLDTHFSFTMKMQPGAALGLTPAGLGYAADVPEGCVAQLGLSALVPMDHFKPQFGPEVIDHNLLQYAPRIIDNHAVFDAGSRKIETMYDGMASLTGTDNDLAVALAAELISVRQVPDTRRYDLVTALNAEPLRRDPWRLISEIDVTTQRWRATGRPIYHYISPRDHALPNSNSGQHPSLPLVSLEGSTSETYSEIDRFERQAFFDRANADAHTITQRVAPLGTSTVLQEFPWDAPSATYFRHRFMLRSRYAGALKARRTAAAWRETEPNLPTKSHVWTVRVAMLADRSRLTLTRPQLRGLIPLTSTPLANEASQPSPPIAAVLQEPPAGRGGLSDRISSEIRTGFGYGFDYTKAAPTQPVGTVKIQDSRKEIGPNPHLTYQAFRGEKTRALALQTEGPLGLTFDSGESSSPAFANSMVLLRPVSFDDQPPPPLEEAFAAVSLRRYIDPAWLTGAATINTTTSPTILKSGRCWWIEPAGNTLGLAYVPTGGSPVQVASIELQGKMIVVKVFKGPVDSGIGGTESVEAGRFEANPSSRPKLLHQQTAPGTYLVSVLVDSGSSQVLDGRSNVAVVLCSFEWSLPRAKAPVAAGPAASAPAPDSVDLELTHDGQGLVVWETMASSPTALRWTQISRDFDIVNTVDSSGDRISASPLRASRLRAKLSTNQKTLSFVTEGEAAKVRLCGTTTGNRYPANVHRHLAMVSSSFLGELGRSVERFNRATLSLTDEPRFAREAKGSEHALRVVEFETPAAILCAQTVQAPLTYKQAYFDLVRTGYKEGQALLITMRFVGAKAHLKEFENVHVTLEQKDAPGGSTKLTQPITTGSEPRSMHIYIDGKNVRSWVVYEKTAGPVIKGNNMLKFNCEETPGFTLKLDVDQKVTAEFWADISVLHVKPVAVDKVTGEPIDATAIDFDFGWLFSPEEEGDPQSLVSARKIAEMVEAQARIITVSPPIPVSLN